MTNSVTYDTAHKQYRDLKSRVKIAHSFIQNPFKIKATKHLYISSFQAQIKQILLLQTCPYSAIFVNPLTPNNPYRGRTAPLTSKVAFYIFIQQIYVLNILNMVYTLLFFLSLQNAVCFIILTYLVPVLFTFYIKSVLKLKKKSGAKRLKRFTLRKKWLITKRPILLHGQCIQ